MPSPPRVDTLLLCDLVLDDRRTGRPTLVGLVDALQSEVFPIEIPPLVVYARMTGLRGTYRFRADLIAPDLSTVLCSAPSRVPVFFDDPLHGHALDLRLPGARIRVPGRHVVRLPYDGEIAAEIGLPVERTESSP